MDILNSILEKLSQLEQKLMEQNLLQKEVLTFNETCIYLDTSQSHLYKLTSRKQIPHFCPEGKKLYFNRKEMDIWLQRNKQSAEEVQKEALSYLNTKKKS